jgi:hypothetical protein
MKTTMIFKRAVNVEGTRKVEIKTVEVEIPGISASEGWAFVDMVDKVIVGNEETKNEQ